MQASNVDQYLYTSGEQLRYRVEGHGPAVILLHGWTLDLDMWNAVAAALGKRYRVVRIDRRGFGMSTGYPSIVGDISDMYALCQHLSLESIAVVGMSQAARAALGFAVAHPELLACLVLDGPPPTGPASARTASDLPYAHYCALARAQGLEAFRREWRHHALTRLVSSAPAVHALLEQMLERYPGRDLVSESPPSVAAAAAPAIGAKVQAQPMLVINGALDIESRKEGAREFASRFADAEYVEISEAGHLCALDNPLAYSVALGSFLDRHLTSFISSGELS